MEQQSIFVGIDVAKAQLDVAVRLADDRWEISHDDAGIGQLVSQLKSLGPAMVLVEASGGLELPLVAALATEELPVVVVNPRQVRDFARAIGKLAKTTPWMQRYWPISPKRSGLPCALCETPRHRPSTRW